MADDQKPVEKVEEQPSAFSGYRTYLMGAGIIIHQLLSAFGIDLPDQLWSQLVDVGLGIGVLVYRWKAKQK